MNDLNDLSRRVLGRIAPVDSALLETQRADFLEKHPQFRQLKERGIVVSRPESPLSAEMKREVGRLFGDVIHIQIIRVAYEDVNPNMGVFNE